MSTAEAAETPVELDLSEHQSWSAVLIGAVIFGNHRFTTILQTWRTDNYNELLETARKEISAVAELRAYLDRSIRLMYMDATGSHTLITTDEDLRTAIKTMRFSHGTEAGPTSLKPVNALELAGPNPATAPLTSSTSQAISGSTLTEPGDNSVLEHYDQVSAGISRQSRFVWILSKPLSWGVRFAPLADLSEGKPSLRHWGVLVTELSNVNIYPLLVRRLPLVNNIRLGSLFELHRVGNCNTVNRNLEFSTNEIHSWPRLSSRYVAVTSYTDDEIEIAG